MPEFWAAAKAEGFKQQGQVEVSELQLSRWLPGGRGGFPCTVPFGCSVRNGGRQVRPWPAGRFGGARKFATLAIAARLWALCPGRALEALLPGMGGVRLVNNSQSGSADRCPRIELPIGTELPICTSAARESTPCLAAPYLFCVPSFRHLLSAHDVIMAPNPSGQSALTLRPLGL